MKNLCTQKEGGWHSTLLFRPCHSSKWYWKIYRRVESPFTRRKIINEFKDIENAVYNCVPKIELEILAPIVQICELFTQLENRRIADEIWTCGRHIGLDPASPPKKKKTRNPWIMTLVKNHYSKSAIKKADLQREEKERGRKHFIYLRH